MGIPGNAATLLTALDTPLISATLDIPLVDPAERGHRVLTVLAAAEKGLDFLAVLAAIYVSDVLYRALAIAAQPRFAPATFLLCAAGFALLFVFLLDRHGGYRADVSLLAIRETERILRVTLQTFLLALLTAYLCAAPLSRLAFLMAVVAVPFFLTLEKWEMQRLVRAWRSRVYGTRRAVILGAGPAGKRIYSALLRSPKFGVDPVAFVDDDPHNSVTEIYESSYTRKQPVKVLAGPLCPQLFRQLDASVLVIASSEIDRGSLATIMAQASAAGVSICCVTGDFLEPGYWIDYAELDGIMVAYLSKARSRMVYNAGKRALDLIVSTAVLLMLGPTVRRHCRAGEVQLAGAGSLPARARWTWGRTVYHVQIPDDVPGCPPLRLFAAGRRGPARHSRRPLSAPHQPG